MENLLAQALLNSGSAETETEALEMIKEMHSRVIEGEDPEEVLYDYGLEPDYVFDLLM